LSEESKGIDAVCQLNYDPTYGRMSFENEYIGQRCIHAGKWLDYMQAFYTYNIRH
jgi:hypothetical protein